MAADCSRKLNTNNVVYMVHACYCSLLSFLSFCFSSISNFLSPTPSCPASPLLPLNWNQLSHSILSFSPLSSLLVTVGLGSNRIYDGSICASVGLCVSNWFLFFFFLLFPNYGGDAVVGLWFGCNFGGWRLWFWLVVIVAVVVVAIVVVIWVLCLMRFFFFFSMVAGSWMGFVASGLWWFVVGVFFFFFFFF